MSSAFNASRNICRSLFKEKSIIFFLFLTRFTPTGKHTCFSTRLSFASSTSLHTKTNTSNKLPSPDIRNRIGGLAVIILEWIVFYIYSYFFVLSDCLSFSQLVFSSFSIASRRCTVMTHVWCCILSKQGLKKHETTDICISDDIIDTTSLVFVLSGRRLTTE